MYRKITLTEIGNSLSDKKMFTSYPKAETLNFIRQFAYAYHAERELPLPLSSMILN